MKKRMSYLLHPKDKEQLGSYDVNVNQKEGKTSECDNAYAQYIEEQDLQQKLNRLSKVKMDRRELKGRGRRSAGPFYQEKGVCSYNEIFDVE